MKRLNLLPEELRPGGRRGSKGPFIGLSPVVVGGVLGVSVVAAIVMSQGAAAWRYRTETIQLKTELDQLRTLSAQLNEQQQRLAVQRGELLAQRERLRAKWETLEQARQPAVPVSEILAELARVLPQEVWITKLSWSDETLKVTGAARDTQQVAVLIAAMDGSGRFRETTFAYTQRSPQPQDPGFVFEVSTTPVMQDKIAGTR